MVGLPIRRLVESYYDIQKMRIEAWNRIVNWVRDNRDKVLAIVAKYKDVFGEGALETLSKEENRKYAEFCEKYLIKYSEYFPEVKEIVWLWEELLELEKKIYNKLQYWVKDQALYEEYLKYVSGMGPVLSAGLIAWYSPFSRFSSPSKLWKYSGLAPGQESYRRRHGVKLNYSPKLKSFVIYRLGMTLLKLNKPFKQLYDEGKQIFLKKHPNESKLHAHYWALRRAVKIFLACVWAVAYKLETGQEPPTKPYPIERLGHKDIITPEFFITKRRK